MIPEHMRELAREIRWMTLTQAHFLTFVRKPEDLGLEDRLCAALQLICAQHINNHLYQRTQTQKCFPELVEKPVQQATEK